MIATRPAKSALAAVLAASAVAACSGGGGSGSPTPAPAPAPTPNQGPVFSSSASLAIDENADGVIYEIEVADADGDPIDLAVEPGFDEAAFAVDLAARTVAFAQPPDFEAPADSDGDNVYVLRLVATDGSGATGRLTLTVTIVDAVETASLQRVGTGFDQPLFAAPLPGSDRLAIVEKGGLVRLLDPDTGAIDSTPMLDLRSEVSSGSEQGLLGLAFSPDFASDGAVYVSLTNTAGDTEIRRYALFSGSTTQFDPATEDLLLRIAQPQDNHNAGWIGFSADGLLYVPTGDGGGSGDPSGFAQNPASLLGKILRIDVNGDDFPADTARDYAIPPGNPFSATGGAPEVFALGLRNPFRASLDRQTGDLFIGDVGQGAIEEIDRLASGDAGANFGWARREGTQSFNGGADDPGFTPPVAEYAHGDGPREGRSVTGGLVYRGPVAALDDAYVFADFVTGNFWSVPLDDLVNGATVASSAFEIRNDLFTPDAGALSNPAAFALGGQGELYVVDLGGDVFELEASG